MSLWALSLAGNVRTGGFFVFLGGELLCEFPIKQKIMLILYIYAIIFVINYFRISSWPEIHLTPSWFLIAGSFSINFIYFYSRKDLLLEYEYFTPLKV